MKRLALLLAASICLLRGAGDPFQAIRNNNLVLLKEQIGTGVDVNTRDSRGATLLMHAAAFGSTDAVRLLLEAGADVNARNQFDATALMWGAGDPVKVRLLVERGADVNAKSKQGRTPLLIAAGYQGSAETLKLLLAKGADLNATDRFGSTALLMSIGAEDRQTQRMLIDMGVDVNAALGTGGTPLMAAASANDLEIANLLIAKGAKVNAFTDVELSVKNGPIGLRKLTPLMFAATYGSAPLVKKLIAAGADVNAKDVRGMTPLMLAVASETQDPEVARALVSSGAEFNVKSAAGETALDWAAKYESPEVIAVLEKAGAKKALAFVAPQAPKPDAPRNPRQSIEKSVALLQRCSAEFFTKSGCVGCHHQNMTALAVAAARSNGVRVDDAAAAEQQRTIKFEWASRRENLLQMIFPGGAPDSLLYSLLSLAAEGYPADPVTDGLVFSIASQQHPDGSWDLSPTGTFLTRVSRSPLEESDINRTAMSVRALRIYGFPGRKSEFDKRIERARAWLLAAKPKTNDDRVWQLLGLAWSGAERADIADLGRKLIAQQRQDGGWAQLPNLASDAFGTGEALYALRESAILAGEDAAYQRGVRFLLNTQFDDGSWYVRSRAPKFQPYFTSGFPLDHDQWISAAATAWAVVALAPVSSSRASH